MIHQESTSKLRCLILNQVRDPGPSRPFWHATQNPPCTGPGLRGYDDLHICRIVRRSSSQRLTHSVQPGISVRSFSTGRLTPTHSAINCPKSFSERRGPQIAPRPASVGNSTQYGVPRDGTCEYICIPSALSDVFPVHAP